VVIPDTFPTVAIYKQVLTAALTGMLVINISFVIPGE
jgi:hypothetical protein